MGFGRAGWYSWDILDNLGRRSATELHPEWMITVAGEPMPAGPLEFDTAIVDEPGRLVLALLGGGAWRWNIDFTLAYRLDPVDAGTRTRLVTRARGRIDGPGGRTVARRILGPGDGVMVRKQLRGIKTRAERLACAGGR